MKKAQPFRCRLVLSILALALVAATAAGAAENRYLLRADLSGETCPAELVLVEATGCEPAAVAQELIRELVAEGFDAKGFDATDCSASGLGKDEQTCWYRIPDGCELTRSSITVEAGDSCLAEVGATGRDLGTVVGFHFFAIDA